jgi:large subunit ribosomal protein L4e
MATRPLVTINGGQTTVNGKSKQSTVPLPDVFLSPLRLDVVKFVHTQMAKNRRHPYAVNEMAGMQHSAESWGTGRAVSRIPRVSGGGTHRAGQGAFGNMCRKGRMFAPTKTFRRWHRRINKKQRRFAVCSALAATAVPALVMSRGHRIEQVSEIPLVISDRALGGLTKTKQAVKLLSVYKATADVERVADSRKVRVGRGKARNRRHVQKRGPLFVHSTEGKSKLTLSLRNIPGVDLVHVTRLNLLQLAPGGHLGRFVVWTESAFKQLNKIFGTKKVFSQQKRHFKPPQGLLTNPDISRIMAAQEVKSVLRGRRRPTRKHVSKKNPLKNLKAMVKLNPHALTTKRRALVAAEAGKKKRQVLIEKARKSGAEKKAGGEKKPADKKKTDKKAETPEQKKAAEAKATKRSNKRASKKFVELLTLPAVAPPRSEYETAPKF